MSFKTVVHKSAQEGFTEGLQYEKCRPTYTDQLVNHVIQSLYTGKSEHRTQYDVLELGAGTGKFTRKILDSCTQHLRYLATEPLDEFLRILKQLCPNVAVKQCDSTDIQLADQSVQNVICAQCFHWFANKESVDEILRVLVPGGRLFCIWIHRDRTVGWAKSMEDILTKYYEKSNTPQAIASRWKHVLENCADLQLLEQKFLPGVQNMKGSKSFVIDHYATISVIAMLDVQARKKALDEFNDVLDKFFDDVEEITIPFIIECYFVEKNKYHT